MTFPAAVDGVGSMLPAASIARTAKRWPPAASRLYERGETQRPNDAESRRHWNLEGPRGGNLKLADVAVVFAAGRELILVSGGVASTDHEYEMDPTLPARSVARTVTACPPSPRAPYDAGELQGSRARSSSLHWNVAGSSAENASLAIE